MTSTPEPIPTQAADEQAQQWASLAASMLADHEIHNQIHSALDMILAEATANRYVDEKYVKANLELVAEEMDIEWPEDPNEG